MDLEATLQALAPRLLRYCAVQLPDGGGEEIAQECLMALVKAWQASRVPTNPDAFVFAIAKRRVRRGLIRRRLALPLEFLKDQRHRQPDPESLAMAEEERRRLAAAIRQLPHTDREVLLLVVIGEQDISDAAMVLGISTPAVKMRLVRARQKLRRIMGDVNE